MDGGLDVRTRRIEDAVQIARRGGDLPRCPAQLLQQVIHIVQGLRQAVAGRVDIGQGVGEGSQVLVAQQPVGALHHIADRGGQVGQALQECLQPRLARADHRVLEARHVGQDVVRVLRLQQVNKQ